MKADMRRTITKKRLKKRVNKTGKKKILRDSGNKEF